MKIDWMDEEHFTIYYFLVFDDILEYDIQDLKTFLQVLVLRLRKKYHLKVEGYYHLDVYIKKILILEFEKIDDYEDEVDLNIVIHKKTPVLVKFSDFFLVPGHKYFYDHQFYLPIEEVSYEKYVEFFEVIYGKEANRVLTEGILMDAYTE